MGIRITQPGAQPSALSKLVGAVKLGLGADALAQGPSAVGTLKAGTDMASGLDRLTDLNKPASTSSQDAMTKRLDFSSQSDFDIINDLQKAEIAMNDMPEEVKKLLGPPLMETILEAGKRFHAGESVNSFRQGVA